MTFSLINQSRARAKAGDIVAGNKNIHIHLPATTPMSQIEQLMKRLSAEIENNHKSQELIASLQFFYIRKAMDDVVGLEAKLVKAERKNELEYAFEKKELFVKLLEKYSFYQSAQTIFTCLLGKTEHVFSQIIHPQIANMDQSAINTLVNERIVEPIVQECCIGPLDINHSVVLGMIYWLAEQCFIRWHQ